MRLIDADELKALRGVAIYATDEKTDTKIITASVYRREEIDKAPTVDAIPISWIRKQAENAQDNHLYPEIVEAALVDLIEEWREECAKQQSTTSE